MLTIKATKQLAPALGVYDFDREADLITNNFNLNVHAVGVGNGERPNPYAHVDLEAGSIRCEATFEGQAAADRCIELLRADGWENAQYHLAA
ncbi:MAG: hypothetical protein ACRBCT_09865 [Alphaproteobacteria bacterium]